ncbi:right-handed parallel beta-helix repeat-containing protein [Natrialbaceae archaeon A-chndr2]
MTTCQEISQPGAYVLADNLSPSETDDLALDSEEHSFNACIAINASGVTLDGQGYTINGSAFYDEDNNPEHSAVLVQNLSEDAWTNEESELYEPTISNITVEEWRYGINFWTTHAPTVTDSTVRSDVPTQIGIHVQHSDYGTFERNDVNTALGVGLAIEESDNATIHDNTIDPARGVATTGDHTTITENEFTNFSQHAIALGRIDAGALLQDAGPALNTTIENNFFDVGTESGSGIRVWYKSDSPVIQNNTMTGTSDQLSGTAVRIERYSVDEPEDDGANYSVIRNNTIDGFTSGIIVENGAYAPEIVDNEVTNTHGSGIGLFSDSDDGIVTGNQITDAGANGVRLLSVQNATISDNVAPENAVGLRVDNSPNSTVSENDFSRSTSGDAILRVGGDVQGTVVEHNNLSNGWNIGVQIGESDGLTLRDNEISGNSDEGIEVSASFSREVTNLTIEGNTITENRLDGILDESSIDAVYADNYIADNEGGTNVKGILVTDDASNVTIRGNTIENHEDSGIEIDHGGTFEIRNNTVRKNKKGVSWSFSAGIDVDSASSGVIAENEVVDNEFGVRVSVDSEDIAVVHNNFDLNPENATEYAVEDPEHYLNATFNWWGAENGPSGGAQDPVTGEYAVGDGDGVDENVIFDPWLTSEPGDDPVDDEPEADLSVVDASLSETDVFEGDVVRITADVENDGDATGEYTAALEIDGTVVANQTVSVGPGETHSVAFRHTFDTAGDYDVTVDGVEAGTVTVTEPEAIFDLSDVSVSEEDVLTGDGVTVSALLENTGTDDGEHVVSLEIDGTVVTNQTVSVDAGETEVIEFTHAFDTAGDYDVTVDGVEAGTVTVTEPEAIFELSDVSVSEEDVVTGEGVTVSALLENTGTDDGEHVASLEIDGTVVANETVSVDAGETEVIEFTHAFDDAGEYEVAVNGVEAGTVSVSEPPSTPSPSPSPSPDPAPETEVSVEVSDDGMTATVTGAVANEPTSIPIGDELGDEAPLSAMTITTAEDGNFDVTIRTTEGLPADADELPNAPAELLTLEIDSSLEADEIDTATLEFYVSGDELATHHLDAGDVTLYHLVDGEWTERDTESSDLFPGSSWDSEELNELFPGSSWEDAEEPSDLFPGSTWEDAEEPSDLFPGSSWDSEELNELFPGSTWEDAEEPSDLFPGSTWDEADEPSDLFPGSSWEDAEEPSDLFPGSSWDSEELNELFPGSTWEEAEEPSDLFPGSSWEDAEEPSDLFPGSSWDSEELNELFPGSTWEEADGPSDLFPGSSWEDAEEPSDLFPGSSWDSEELNELFPGSTWEDAEEPSDLFPGSTWEDAEEPSDLFPDSSRDSEELNELFPGSTWDEAEEPADLFPGSSWDEAEEPSDLFPGSSWDSEELNEVFPGSSWDEAEEPSDLFPGSSWEDAEEPSDLFPGSSWDSEELNELFPGSTWEDAEEPSDLFPGSSWDSEELNDLFPGSSWDEAEEPSDLFPGSSWDEAEEPSDLFPGSSWDSEELNELFPGSSWDEAEEPSDLFPGSSWEETDVSDPQSGAYYSSQTPHFSAFALAGHQPDITVVDHSASETTLSVGEAVTFEATVQNDGGATGNYSVEIEVDDAVVATESVSVEPGAETEVTISYTFETTGEYALAVDGVDAGTAVVEDTTDDPDSSDDVADADDTDDVTDADDSDDVADADDTDDVTDADDSDDVADADDTDDGDDGLPGFGAVVALLALASVFVVARRR